MKISDLSKEAHEKALNAMAATEHMSVVKKAVEEAKNEEELCFKLNKLGQDLVWYVCYGSNLCYDRFMCYITGKENKKYGVKAGEPCKNLSKPKDQAIIEIPYEMFFGYSSPSWDYKGVAFLRREKNENAHTVARAYLITKEQFEHVWDREGRNPKWYGCPIELEPIKGIPARTFTSYEDHSPNDPTERYAKVIFDGLIECGLSKDEASSYIANRLKD